MPNNVAIVLAGDFNPDAVIAIIDRYFGSWKPSKQLSRPEFEAQKTITSPRDTTVIGLDAENIMMGWRFKGANQLQNDTLDIVNRMLSNGKAGLLDININQPMKAMETGTYLDELHDYSMLLIEGVPLQNQKLDDLKALILAETTKLGRGEFSDDLLPAVLANKKLQFYKSLDSNQKRVSMMVDAFVNDKPWADVTQQIERQEKLTKQDIIDFARHHLRTDNYACVYKQMGTDTTLKKIEKPIITPIPANREFESKFLNEIRTAKTEPIQPVFVDFKKELTFSNTKSRLPLIYKKNTDDGIFDLVFRYDFGYTANKLNNTAFDYLDYIGTNDMTVSQIKQAFYKLACKYYAVMDQRTLSIYLTGLNENMPQALQLLEKIMHQAKADKASWSRYCDMVEKARNDAKTDQKANFNALWDYAIYGKYNPTRDKTPVKDLRTMDPQQLVDMLAQLEKMQHTVLYYGASDLKQLDKLLTKEHPTPAKWAPMPVNKPYKPQLTAQNEVLIAPYDAKNIYLRQYNNEGKTWSLAKAPVETLFNQYFGGGMNTVVFQELRETRALAYNAYAMYNRPQHKGETESFFTHIISQNDKMADCIKVFNEIVDSMPQNEAAFDLAKQSLTKSIQSERTTKFNIFQRYLFLKQLGLDHDYMQDIYAALPKLTLQDIVSFARQNIAHKPYRYAVLGNEKNLDMKVLEKIAPVKRLTTEDIFGE